MKSESYHSLKSYIANNSPVLRPAYLSVASAWNLVRSRNKRFLSAPPGHFYSPLPDVATVSSVFDGLDSSVARVPDVLIDDEAQVALTKRFSEYYDELPFSETAVNGRPFYLDNGWFPYGDAVILYSMMRHLEPRRIVEVGSGFSSGAMIEVNERFFDGRIELTFIEPRPDRLYNVLEGSNLGKVSVITEDVQDVEPSHFEQLGPGDILFVDSSHVAKLGSDVLHLIFTVLPSLRPGVHIHFHDILWPFEYPRDWLESGRAWNEAYFVRAFLQDNASYEVAYFNSYMAHFHQELLAEHLPLALSRPSARKVPRTPGNSSLWVTKRSTT